MLEACGVAAFASTGGKATAKDTAAAICPNLVKFANMASSELRPFLYTFGAMGARSKGEAIGATVAQYLRPRGGTLARMLPQDADTGADTAICQIT